MAADKTQWFDHICETVIRMRNEGMTAKQIQQLTKVPPCTQYNIANKMRNRIPGNNRPNCSMWNNNQAKITEEYINQYADRNAQLNVLYTANFCKVHGPRFGKLKFINICSSDEAESTINC